MPLCRFYSIFLLLLLPSTAAASEIFTVITASPEWDTFTNRNGSGLYHEVLREVFGLYGVTVRHEYVTSNRAEELVRQGAADMALCDDEAEPPLVLARYPLYENAFYAFFNRWRIGQWDGVRTMRGKVVLVQPSYYSADDFSVPLTLREVMTGTQAVSMVLMNRADFYVDDMALIKASLRASPLSYEKKDFEVRRLGSRTYFPLFHTTPRAMRIRRMYDDGLRRMYDEGRLQPLYEKWGYHCPDLNAY